MSNRTDQKFIKSGLTFTTANLLVNGLNFLSNFVLARLFTVEVFGEYAATASYGAILSVPLSTLSLIVIKKVSSSPKKNQLPITIRI